MKMKNLTLILLTSLMIVRVEGMENLSKSIEEEIISSSLCQFSFDSFIPEMQVEDSSATAILYSKKIQSDLVQDFDIYIKNICTLEIRCEEKKSGECLSSNLDPQTIIQCFKNKEETLNFLRLLEKTVSKHQSYIRETRKQYEELLKNTEAEYKEGQKKAIETVKIIHGNIRNSIANIKTVEWSGNEDEDKFNQSLISIFNFDLGVDFEAFDIIVGNNKQTKRILVHFNNLDETSLFLEKLSNLKFLSFPIIQKIEGIIGSVEKLKQG